MKRFGLLIFAILLLCVARTRFVRPLHPGGPAAAAAKSAVETGADPGTTGMPQEHFSPNENLESFDIAQIEKAHSSIDIAMYAFTDRALAETLLHTDPNVQIRLYRDGEQFENEQWHATYGRPSTTQMLAGCTRIHIRVKRGDLREYMHCKRSWSTAWC